MKSAYEKFADVFMATMAGEMSGLTREQFIAVCRQKYPDEADFAAVVAAATAQAEEAVRNATAKLDPGGSLAVGYVAEIPKGRVH